MLSLEILADQFPLNEDLSAVGLDCRGKDNPAYMYVALILTSKVYVVTKVEVTSPSLALILHVAAAEPTVWVNP